MTPDEEIAPAAERPQPLREVGPRPGDMRHCGSSFELVLNATVPQLVVEVDVHNTVSMALRDPAEGRGQVIAHEIPEVQREVPPRVVPQKREQRRTAVRFEDVPVPQVTSQERISERIREHIVDVPGLHGIPQERISQRIQEPTQGCSSSYF